MDKMRTYSGRIDKAFSFLLMANDMLEKIIPGSDDEQARALAAKFVAELIRSAVEQLIPNANNRDDMREFLARPQNIFDAAGYLDEGGMIDTVDLDAIIARHLSQLTSAQT